MTPEQTYEKEYAKALDVADTIIHFRGAGALPTIASMDEFIKSEQKLNHLDTQFCFLTEDIVRDAGEWYDRESEPE